MIKTHNIPVKQERVEVLYMVDLGSVVKLRFEAFFTLDI